MNKIIRVLLSLVLVLSLMLSMVSCYDGEKYTSDIADYNTEKYPLRVPFPKTIPENAEVVKFVWHDYWHEDTDQYLQLRFDSEDALQDFLDELITSASNELTADHTYRPADGNWFFTTENPYDNSFTDCFCKEDHVNIGNKDYFGYEIEIDDDGDYWLSCYYCVISYSLSSRTVIINHASGVSADADGWKPTYFERFSIPNEPVNRLIPVEFAYFEN